MKNATFKLIELRQPGPEGEPGPAVQRAVTAWLTARLGAPCEGGSAPASGHSPCDSGGLPEAGGRSPGEV